MNKESFEIGKLARTEKQNADYKNRDNDPKGSWKPTPLHAKSGTEESRYDFTFANGVTWHCPPGRFPRYSKQTLKELFEGGELYFNSNGGVDKKTYLSEVTKKGVVPGSVLHYESVGHTHANNEELAELVGKGVFDNPKGVRLIQHLARLAKVEEDSIVVDFFSGSGTTAHAVMGMNANDLGRRKYVMVQIAEACDPEKEAIKKGFKTIDEIGRKRIELAAEKIRAENPEKAAALDLGFKHYTLVEPSQETLDKVETFDKAASLVGDEGMLKEFGIETVLATWMVRDGYGFGVEPEVVKFGGYAAYWHEKHLYFVMDGLDEPGVKDLMDRYETDPKFSPVNVVVFGYGVSMTMRENLKTNLAKLVDSEKDLKVNIEVRY